MVRAGQDFKHSAIEDRRDFERLSAMTSHGCFRAVTEVRATSSLHQLSEKMSQITNDFGFDSFAIVKRDPSNLYVEPAVLTNFTDVDQTCDPVRRQNIWRISRRRLAESGLRLGVDVRRRACGVASADIRWFVV